MPIGPIAGKRIISSPFEVATPIDVHAIVAQLEEEDLALQCVKKEVPEASSLQKYCMFLRDINFQAIMLCCGQGHLLNQAA